jgi:hypothetical chaperone protein
MTTSSPSAVPTAYAIDFGTSNSLLAAANPHRVFAPVALDPQAPDPTILRSILYFPSSGAAHFGTSALASYVEHGMEGRLLRSLKRFLPSAEFKFTIIGNRRYRLEELIGAMLRRMRERADGCYGCEVRRALLGRPARYSNSDEDDALAETRMREAASIAGFESVDFCPEPTAAARDFEAELSEPRVVLVADLGGGTSDFCVVRLSREGFGPKDVLATGGVRVAGDDLDAALMKHELGNHFGARAMYDVPFGNEPQPMPAPLMDLLCTPAKLPLLQAPWVRRSLCEILAGCRTAEDRMAIEHFLCVVDDALGFDVFESVEATKRALSDAAVASFRFQYPGMDLLQEVTRNQFESAIRAPLAAMQACLDETLRSAGLAEDSVELVCVTGGTSRVPLVVQALSCRFGSERLRRRKGLHSVVEGLAHQLRRQLAGR